MNKLLVVIAVAVLINAIRDYRIKHDRTQFCECSKLSYDYDGAEDAAAACEELGRALWNEQTSEEYYLETYNTIAYYFSWLYNMTVTLLVCWFVCWLVLVVVHDVKLYLSRRFYRHKCRHCQDYWLCNCTTYDGQPAYFDGKKLVPRSYW